MLFLVFSPAIRKNFNILAQGLNLPVGLIPETATPAEPDTDAEAQSAEQQPANQPVPPLIVQQAEPGPSAPVVQPNAASPNEVSPGAVSPPVTQPTVRPVETRERVIFFTQIDKDGTVLRARAARQIPVSDSPLLDSLNALLRGPTAEERGRGLVSLIPRDTRILSAFVRGNTAYISFNEDFQYNSYGVEGYAAQLRQIIWTATEFSNVNDVQFQVEGRRVDYLGEGIWIGSPLGRDSL